MKLNYTLFCYIEFINYLILMFRTIAPQDKDSASPLNTVNGVLIATFRETSQSCTELAMSNSPFDLNGSARFQVRAAATFSEPAPAAPTPPNLDWSDTFVAFLFSANGRVSRQSYWLSGLAFSAVNLVVLYLTLRPWIAILTGHADIILADGIWYNLVQSLTLLAVSTLLLWGNVVVTIKRWHDLGKSGWWTLIIFVPLVGAIWHLVECGFFPGTTGANPYGPAPR